MRRRNRPDLRVVERRPARRRSGGRPTPDPKVLLVALVVVGAAAAAGISILEEAPADVLPTIVLEEAFATDREQAERVQGNQAQRGERVPTNMIRVTDGDTFRIGGERVRVEDIDTPEVGGGAACPQERRLADEATREAERIFQGATHVSIVRNGTDQYGRTLADVSVEGRDFGDLMIAAGLAQRWEGQKANWCG